MEQLVPHVYVWAIIFVLLFIFNLSPIPFFVFIYVLYFMPCLCSVSFFALLFFPFLPSFLPPFSPLLWCSTGPAQRWFTETLPFSSRALKQLVIGEGKEILFGLFWRRWLLKVPSLITPSCQVPTPVKYWWYHPGSLLKQLWLALWEKGSFRFCSR